MNNVPEIISTTDTIYLKEIFNNCFVCTKKSFDFAEKVADEAIKQELTDTAIMFRNHCKKIIELLQSGGSNEQ